MVTGDGDDRGGGDVSMTIASDFVEDHVLVQSAQKFKEDIEAETDGRFSVEISPVARTGRRPKSRN